MEIKLHAYAISLADTTFNMLLCFPLDVTKEEYLQLIGLDFSCPSEFPREIIIQNKYPAIHKKIINTILQRLKEPDEFGEQPCIHWDEKDIFIHYRLPRETWASESSTGCSIRIDLPIDDDFYKLGGNAKEAVNNLDITDSMSLSFIASLMADKINFNQYTASPHEELDNEEFSDLHDCLESVFGSLYNKIFSSKYNESSSCCEIDRRFRLLYEPEYYDDYVDGAPVLELIKLGADNKSSEIVRFVLYSKSEYDLSVLC